MFSDHRNSLARWHFSIRLETYSAVMRGLGHAHAGSAAKKIWIGRADLVEPGHDDLRLSM